MQKTKQKTNSVLIRLSVIMDWFYYALKNKSHSSLSL